MNMYYIISQNRPESYCDTSYSSIGGNQMWILKNAKDLLEQVQLWFSPSVIPLQHLTILPSMPLFPTERQVKGVGPTVFHEKNNGQRRCTYLVLGLGIFCFIENKLISSTCSNFHDNIFARLGGRVFQQTPYIFVQTVLLFSVACSCIRMRKASYRGFNFMFCCLDDVLSLFFFSLVISLIASVSLILK